jgi:NADPH2 dehydrogenase
LWSDENEQALARVLSAVRKYSPIPIAMQLGHAGRKGSSRLPWLGGDQQPIDEGGWTTVAPSAVSQADEVPPVALTLDGIANVRDQFVASVERSIRLGVDALELHCAHGYLLHQFLSPLTNQRNDQYGGTLENRMRLPLETFAAMRAVWPAEKPLGVRISASDWIDGGWDIEQSVVFCKQHGELGCDWIDVSSGGLAPEQQIKLGPGYQLAFAEQIKRETGLPTMAVGLITEPQQAEDVIEQGKADMVALARGMLWNPHWPYQAAGELGAQVSAPPQYLRAAPHHFKNVFKA